MATTGNRDWAFSEASRRCRALDRPYSIYQHKRHDNDYIVRPYLAEAPNGLDWRLIAIIRNAPNGPHSD